MLGRVIIAPGQNSSCLIARKREAREAGKLGISLNEYTVSLSAPLLLYPSCCTFGPCCFCCCCPARAAPRCCKAAIQRLAAKYTHTHKYILLYTLVIKCRTTETMNDSLTHSPTALTDKGRCYEMLLHLKSIWHDFRVGGVKGIV